MRRLFQPRVVWALGVYCTCSGVKGALLGLWVVGFRLTGTFVTPLRSHHICGGEFYWTKVPIDTLVSARREARQIDERENSGDIEQIVIISGVTTNLLKTADNPEMFDASVFVGFGSVRAEVV